MSSPFFIEVGYASKSHADERICGDVFLSKKVEGNQRTIAVLSDGMGHGVKANILATLTATMALNFTEEHAAPNKIVRTILKALPVCSERQVSYATFTIVDISANQDVTIIEYDNPQTIIMRGRDVFDPEWQCIMPSSDLGKGKEILTCTFTPQKEDRIIIWTDGVTQSGLGTSEYPTGWGLKEALKFTHRMVNAEPEISAQKLAAKIVNMAHINDIWRLKDDTSCAVLYLRHPRKLLICTGPPVNEENDKVLAHRFAEFAGTKIICGATTANIISRETSQPIVDDTKVIDRTLPPTSRMEGADLVTEGILTLSKAFTILDGYTENVNLDQGPAHAIAKHILNSDEITFVVGTRINEANQDPRLPFDLEVRRSLIGRLKALLEQKLLKEVLVELV